MALSSPQDLMIITLQLVLNQTRGESSLHFYQTRQALYSDWINLILWYIGLFFIVTGHLGNKSNQSVLSFQDNDEDGNNNDEDPDVTTDDAEDVEDDRAELHGEVDMNDFNNGVVFFVYGEDEDQVEDVEDDVSRRKEDTWHDVDEQCRISLPHLQQTHTKQRWRHQYSTVFGHH